MDNAFQHQDDPCQTERVSTINFQKVPQNEGRECDDDWCNSVAYPCWGPQEALHKLLVEINGNVIPDRLRDTCTHSVLFQHHASSNNPALAPRNKNNNNNSSSSDNNNNRNSLINHQRPRSKRLCQTQHTRKPNSIKIKNLS